MALMKKLISFTFGFAIIYLFLMLCKTVAVEVLIHSPDGREPNIAKFNQWKTIIKNSQM